MTYVQTFPRLTHVHAIGNHRIHLRYADGAEGEVSIARSVERGGVFERLRDPDAFAAVHIGPSGQVRWDEELELCADALYLEVTQQSLDEVVAQGGGATADA